jgi:type III pantothenate kinase
MILAIDIGNTHTDIGLADQDRVLKSTRVRTDEWGKKEVTDRLRRFVGRRVIQGTAIASVVPAATSLVEETIEATLESRCVCLSHRNVVGLGVDYPKPNSIGADRLANAMAALKRFGGPVVVVDFGTAVTFDVVDRRGYYVGGIIAPGLGAMTDYLHEKTALLPRVTIRDPKRTIGKSTREAMLIGAVKGYRGLISNLIRELKAELNERRLRVVATGGYADLMAKGLPEVSIVDQYLTLDGLRLLALDCFKLSSNS